jgi:hypothetical protein
VNGSANLSYDTAASCTAADSAAPTSGSITRTSAGVVLTIPNNAGVINETSNSTSAYTGESVGGGERVSFSNATSYSIAILGVNRTMFTSSGLKVFDHSIKTSSDIQISGSFATHDRTVNGGSVVLYHNRLRFTATSALGNLRWSDANCCLPRAGSITSTLRDGSGTLLETWDINFGAGGLSCGQAALVVTSATTGQTVTSTISLPDCQ